MNQSHKMYTPTICAVGGEHRCMPYFTEMVEELWKIEKQEFIEVEGVKIPLKIKVGVVGDKSFMWKFTT